VYEISLAVSACLRSGTRADVARFAGLLLIFDLRQLALNVRVVL